MVGRRGKRRESSQCVPSFIFLSTRHHSLIMLLGFRRTGSSTNTLGQSHDPSKEEDLQILIRKRGRVEAFLAIIASNHSHKLRHSLPRIKTHYHFSRSPTIHRFPPSTGKELEEDVLQKLFHYYRPLLFSTSSQHLYSSGLNDRGLKGVPAAK